MFIPIKYFSPLAEMPKKAHETDACWDVKATSRKDYGDGRIEYGLGFGIDLPPGMRLDLRPRSSVHKHGMILSNCIGTGDNGYKGEYKAVFYHVLPSLPAYEVGDRILQIHLEFDNRHVHWQETKELQDSPRGTGGYGSAGK